MTLKSFGILQTRNQLVGYFIAFNPHYALFDAAVAWQVYAAVPNDFPVGNGKFLMNVRFKIQ